MLTKILMDFRMKTFRNLIRTQCVQHTFVVAFLLNLKSSNIDFDFVSIIFHVFLCPKFHSLELFFFCSKIEKKESSTCLLCIVFLRRAHLVSDTAAHKILLHLALNMNLSLACVDAIIYPPRYITADINLSVFTTLHRVVLHKLRDFLSQ